MNSSFDETFLLFQSVYKIEYLYRDNITTILNNLCKEIETATMNHLSLNFWSRLYKHIQRLYSITNPLYVYDICIGILSEEYFGNDWIVCKYREKMDYTTNNSMQIKQNPLNILRVLREILQYNTKCGYKIFSLLPSSTFKSNYITIDYSHLNEILPITAGKFNENQREYWKTFFNIERFEDPKWKFHSFQTDGKSVSVKLCNQFTEREDGSFIFKKVRSKRKIEDETIVVAKKPKKQRVVKISSTSVIDPTLPVKAFDPGIRFMFMGVSTDDEFEKLSSKKWYHEIGHTRLMSSFSKVYKKSGLEKKISDLVVTSKVYTVCEYMKYLKNVFTISEELFNFYFSISLRNWKFTKYQKEQKMIDKICKQITGKISPQDPDKYTIGFGDWSMGSNSIIKGHQRGPVTKLIKQLEKWTTIHRVDEYKTSKLCCDCFSETDKVEFPNQNKHKRKRKRKKRKKDIEQELIETCTRKVNSVLRCNNNECKFY